MRSRWWTSDSSPPAWAKGIGAVLVAGWPLVVVLLAFAPANTGTWSPPWYALVLAAMAEAVWVAFMFAFARWARRYR